ncbi:RAD55 family ATPase [Natronomonas marina]|jgi:KaiC/GvpD/RAD55 family RecA-like ATPase|uniref:RAD55 family ATPase n=1 Tax=Natronomonas marina TaxID=2961939 RepID=UPI0020CA13C7|nr:transcriptional regulator [Natronomonas marina]
METGVDIVDDHLGGGIPKGSLVAVVAPPQTQSELLLYRITAQRPTLYLSTLRDEASVKRAFDRSSIDIGNPMVAYAGPGIGFDEIGDVVGRAGTGMNLIVDTADTLERRDPDDYQSFLNKLHTYVRRTGSIALLHCQDPGPESGRGITLGMADIVFELQRTVTSSDIETSSSTPISGSR